MTQFSGLFVYYMKLWEYRYYRIISIITGESVYFFLLELVVLYSSELRYDGDFQKGNNKLKQETDYPEWLNRAMLAWKEILQPVSQVQQICTE